MDRDFDGIPSCSFYGKKKCRLPPLPQVSDDSDSSDDDENLTLKNLRNKILQARQPNLVYDDTAEEEVYDIDSDSQEDVFEPQPEPETEPAPKRKKKNQDMNFSWIKEDLPKVDRDCNFNPSTNEQLLVPLEYFTKLFSFDILNHIIDQTNLYSTQMTGTCIGTNANEMTDFISLLLLMAIIDLPSYEDYWANGTRIEQIARVMSSKRFKTLRRYIHFNNNENITENTTDRYFKIRPLMEKLRENFRRLHTENQYSIDETIVAYKGTRAGNLRQYVKNKPHKWGYKFFVIAGVSGYILDFIAYQGANTFQQLVGTQNELSQMECDMGVGAGVVIALAKSLHDPSKSALFFDNYFAGLPLFVYLKEHMDICSLGTLRSNRIAGCPIETDKILQKQGRGKYDFKTDKNKGIIVVKWVDNRSVLLGSTLCGIQPTDTVKRFSKDVKAKIDITCPALVKQYNKHMGGVDTANALMGLYKTPHKAKRWYFSIFAYLLDVTVVNSWLLYRKDCESLKQKYMPLKRFRLEIATGLSQCGKESRKSRRSKDSETSTPVIQRPVVERPDLSTRGDCYAHWPIHTSKGRCRLCVKGTSRLKCEKCDARLCLTESKNCFKAFHCK